MWWADIRGHHGKMGYELSEHYMGRKMIWLTIFIGAIIYATLLLTVLLTILTLTTSAEEITTGNLLPNAGDGVDWNSSSTDQINPGSSGYVSNNATMNGFTVTCPTSQSNCGYKWR